MHGRLMGAVESIAALSLAIGLLLGGALVALISPQAGVPVVGPAQRSPRLGALMLLTRSAVRAEA